MKRSLKKSFLLVVFFLNTFLSFGQLLDFEFFMDTTGSCYWNPDVLGTEENPGLQDEGLIYPNPSGGKITMNLPAETKQIEVVSLNGQTLLKIYTAGKKSVSLEHLESGCYMINFISDNDIRTKKIIVNSKQ